MTEDRFEGMIKPEDLRKITEDKEMAELRLALERQKKLEAEQGDVYQAFLNQHVHPEAKARVTLAVRRAAERGEKELQVMKFSSEFCTDKGRAINNFEADWPETLTGFAKEAYEAWEEHLRPLGYKLRAQILDYPNGMPGDVGLILYW
jgi:cyclopropane fatty-acyl-phospholipid synthase-like methyltransferase